MSEFRVFTSGDDPLILQSGKSFHAAISIECHPEGGSIQIEQWNPVAEAWFLPAEPLQLITEFTTLHMERDNRPAVRISAVGQNAFFVTTGGLFEAAEGEFA